jgi:RimJ/RimL family protein N-acetyltransferase
VRKGSLGKGFCTIAARMAIGYAFDELQFQRTEVQGHTENLFSNLVARKLGGCVEGI